MLDGNHISIEMECINMYKNIVFLFGTRPETIKMAPLIKEFEKDKSINIEIILTGQHKEMVVGLLDFFDIKPNYQLGLMKNNQSLEEITIGILEKCKSIFANKKEPTIVFVQGDTTSAFAGALSAFYNKIDVAHVEAGLRSNNKYSPYPEEMNRSLISRIAKYHFAPTYRSAKNLESEGIKEHVYVVGNTVIDALLMTIDKIKFNDKVYFDFFHTIDFSKKIILVTGHRREKFGSPFVDFCSALKEIAFLFKNEVEIVYPVHLNPNVKDPVFRILSNVENIHLIEPIEYPYLIFLLSQSYMVITDSGGIQEEAPTLGKPILVTRDVTERVEGIEAGTAKLVGTDKKKIIDETEKLIKDEPYYSKMANSINPYGDGNSSKRIYEIIKFR